MAAAPAYEAAAAILSPPSDAETLESFTPQDDDAQALEDYINAHPLTASLRVNPEFTESRPHMKIPPSWRRHNLTGGTLSGPGKMAIPPFSWTERDGKSYVQITHVGTDLCGHQGIIHGGFLATMLDEGLARCCFPVLPFNVGMTAKLEINYKAPAMADQYLVLRATTVKVEGRKAWVEGHIETLPEKEGQVPTILATASALYVSPKQAAVSNQTQSIASLLSVLRPRGSWLTETCRPDDGQGLSSEIDAGTYVIVRPRCLAGPTDSADERYSPGPIWRNRLAMELWRAGDGIALQHYMCVINITWCHQHGIGYLGYLPIDRRAGTQYQTIYRDLGFPRRGRDAWQSAHMHYQGLFGGAILFFPFSGTQKNDAICRERGLGGAPGRCPAPDRTEVF